MKRTYEALLNEHFSNERQMAFVAGPRQVGKSTLIDRLLTDDDILFNWDRPNDRQQILQGSDHLMEQCGLLDLSTPDQKRRIAFDEIHKFKQWKNLLKGFLMPVRVKPLFW